MYSKTSDTEHPSYVKTLLIRTLSGPPERFLLVLTPFFAGLTTGFAMGNVSSVACGGDPSAIKEFELPLLCSPNNSSMNARNFWWQILQVIQVGAIVGTLLGTLVSTKSGRKPSIIAGLFVIVVSGIVMAVGASSKLPKALFLARFFSGFGVGMVTHSAPLLIVETSIVRLRGVFMVIFQFFQTVGFVCVYFMSYSIYAEDKKTAGLLSGSLILTSPVIPGVLGLLFLSAVPESPRFLMEKGRFGEAGDSLRHLRSNPDSVQGEMVLIQNNLDNNENDEGLNTSSRLKVCVGVVLSVLHSLCGFSVVLTYGPFLFSLVSPSDGFSVFRWVFMTLCVCAAFAVPLVYYFLRRTILLAGNLLMAVASGVVVFSFKNGAHSSTVGPERTLLFVLGIHMFVAAYASTWGGVGSLVKTELFPQTYRAMMVGVSDFLSNVIVLGIIVYLPSLPVVVVFCSIAVANLLGLLLYSILLRNKQEGYGRSLEEIELDYFRSKNKQYTIDGARIDNTNGFDHGGGRQHAALY